ncbi:MAG TPA: PilZ domain-containing protein [Candidatus Acidoferrum sp.]|nr:PilZ domain-containing protein [Candidatus Acidoferrum sp.]
MSNVISMDDRRTKSDTRSMSVRDRRYCIRYPFAADVEMFDLESGTKIEGVTSDISMGGAFICTSKPLPSNTRLRITLKRKDQQVEALGVVRIVKPRIGMGIEFIDLEANHHEVLRRWVEQLTKSR